MVVFFVGATNRFFGRVPAPTGETFPPAPDAILARTGPAIGHFGLFMPAMRTADLIGMATPWVVAGNPTDPAIRLGAALVRHRCQNVSHA